jgi:hypothetical protein
MMQRRTQLCLLPAQYRMARLQIPDPVCPVPSISSRLVSSCCLFAPVPSRWFHGCCVSVYLYGLDAWGGRLHDRDRDRVDLYVR